MIAKDPTKNDKMIKTAQCTFRYNSSIHKSGKAEVGYHKKGDDCFRKWYEHWNVFIKPPTSVNWLIHNVKIKFSNWGNIILRWITNG